MNGQQTIGIVGGGQLGRMLTLAALPLGFKVVVVDPSPGCPASQVGAEQIIANLYDAKALKKLAEKADYLTIEIEHLDANILEQVAASGTPINPTPKTIKLIQDKFAQKRFLHKAGIPVAPFAEVADAESAKAVLEAFGGKMLIKTKYGAYDGRGNMVIKKAGDIAAAFKTFKGQQLYAEQYIPFVKELAVLVARDFRGATLEYPIVETIHERNICVKVLAPAPSSESVRKQAESIGNKVAKLLDGAGVFAIEMFLTKAGQVLVNEIAPRVHNSGHQTIEANRTSQFEQHIRAISGLPLGSVDLVVPAAVMINILGRRNGTTEVKGLAKALSNPHTNVHIYGKSPTKVDRKMGHITATGKTLTEARRRATQARQQLSI